MTATIETAERSAITVDVLTPALRNAMLFASKDQARPIIAAVHWTIKDGTATLVATDSYRILVQEFPCDGSGSFLLPRGEADRIVKALGKVTLAAVGQVDGMLEVIAGGTSIRCDLTQGDFPNWQALCDGQWGELEAGPGAFTTHYNASYLADIGKVKPLGSSNSKVTEVTFGAGLSPLKPARFDVRTTVGRVYGALMPCKPR